MDGGGHLVPLSYVYGYRGDVGRRGVAQDTIGDNGLEIRAGSRVGGGWGGQVVDAVDVVDVDDVDAGGQAGGVGKGGGLATGPALGFSCVLPRVLMQQSSFT